MLFSELGLSEPVLKAVEKCGYEHPTPIQEQAIPVILEGRDLIGASQTGTGKTAAFALPLLTKLQPIGKPQILVLEPTRELADQVAEAFAEYGEFTGLKVALLYGGVGYGKQTEDLKKGADIVVATPGRLVDHFYRCTMRFGEVKALVLDEVDRMLDMGFLPIVRKIVNLCPWEGRQTLFFSATMPPVIAGFAKWCLTDPAEVTIARREVAATISHAFYPVALDQRDELLLALLKGTDFRSVMISPAPARRRMRYAACSSIMATAGRWPSCTPTFPRRNAWRRLRDSRAENTIFWWLRMWRRAALTSAA